MTAYYNEHDAYAAAWLRNLIAAGHIAAGDVDARDIQDVTPDDLTGYTQCHFFAGLGGWSYALRLAGWPDDRPVWTGSCPCQPLQHRRGHRPAGRGRLHQGLSRREAPRMTVHCVTCGHEWDLLIKIPMDLDRFVKAVNGCAAAGCPQCGAEGNAVICGPVPRGRP